METREIIEINEDLCNGCGKCIPGCPEGALQIIDGKARLVSDLFCDGLGACVGECPVGAMKVVKRPAEKYDEFKVMENIVKQGDNTVAAHLKHLKEHGADNYYNDAIKFLNDNGYEVPKLNGVGKHEGGCPGSKMMDFSNEELTGDERGDRPSQLRQWPVQLHLVSPMAPFFADSDLLLAADCVAFALGDFHKNYLKGKSLAIACPKLDERQELYVGKLVELIDNENINTITVMIMEVPCCGGLLQLAKQALDLSSRVVPIKKVVVGIKGDIVSESWI